MLRPSSLRTVLLGSAMLAATFAAGPATADTLREALLLAYQNNPTLTGARAGQRAIDENVPLALADGRPRLGALGSYTENVVTSSNSFSSPRRQAVASAQLSVPIYQGGAVRNAIRAADQRVDAGQADLRATESAIFSQVVAAYMDVIRDSAIVGLNRAQVGVLSVNLEATSDRFQIGDLTRTDVAQSEARLQLSISDLQTARANLIASKENYIALVGQPPEDLQPPPPLPNLPENPDEAVDIALANNPDILAARERSDAAEYDIGVARASRKPSLSAIGDSSYTNSLDSLQSPAAGLAVSQESTAASIGVQLNIPLYQGGRPGALIRQAQARSSQAYEQVIAVERSVIAQTRSAYASWQAALEVIESSQRAVAAADLSLEGVRAENSVGNRTILDILDAEQELLNAQVQLVLARRNAYVAGFSLLAAMGRAEARDLNLDGGTLYDPELNFRRVRNKISDFASDPDPEPEATRTVDTPAQAAPVAPLPEISSDSNVAQSAARLYDSD